jgi:energy-coupling factor transport system ATP-binding protein
MLFSCFYPWWCAELHSFLSKGLRQRVAIASILALRPQVIIVDEPTTGQDARQSLEIMDFLNTLNEEHTHTIIIITHDMPIVARYTRRVVAMGQGRIMADGPTREVFTQSDILQNTFLAPLRLLSWHSWYKTWVSTLAR